jgi:hypothetical protein
MTIRIAHSLIGTLILAGLVVLAYGVDWMSMLWAPLP